MILPYLLRLLCLSFASFFLLNAACSAFLQVLSKSAVHFAETRPAAAAARFLFVLRLLPFALAALFVFGLCVPSYLWLEPSATSEKVGALCVLFGTLGAAAWLFSLARAARAILNSFAANRRWSSQSAEPRSPAESRSLLVVDSDSPILAMSGLFRPRLVISRRVLKSLSAEELDAALSHEQAHCISRDNLKRLLLLLTPDIFPGVRFLRSLEAQWSKLTEWAADDHAARPSSLRAVSLASALVRVARLGAAPRLPDLSTSLLGCDRDLSVRVARLLVVDAVSPARAPQTLPFLRLPSYLFPACLAFALLSPAILSPVHQLLERFLH